jgi:hypothetical protein
MAHAYHEMSNHMAQCKQSEEAEAEEAKKKEAEEKAAKEAEEAAKAAGDPSTLSPEKKEAAYIAKVTALEAKITLIESQLLVQKGENAKLMNESKAEKLVKYLDKKLAETKLDRSVTKKIRESLGVVKSEKDVDNGIKTFMTGWSAAQGELREGELVITVEKGAESEEDGLDLSDCKE